MIDKDKDLDQLFFRFDAKTWSTFRHKQDRLNLTEDDLKRLVAFNDIISLESVSNIYLPLSRLLYLDYSSRMDRLAVLRKFLGKQMDKVPYTISISGSVAVGKTTTAKLLQELLKSWPSHPDVALITTDGFLYPNKILNERMLTSHKGFPISYDTRKLMHFMEDLKDGKSNLKVPVYSHQTYDVVPGEFITVNRPDILIIEGVNVLQNGSEYPGIRNRSFISDYIDFSIYVDAEEAHLLKWYIERFLKLRELTFADPGSYFHRYATIPEDQAVYMAKLIWEAVNHVNLIENILPCRSRANLILRKAEDHSITEVLLKK